MTNEVIYQPDPDQYQKIWPLIKDFIKQPRPQIYENIFAQNIATAGNAVKWYAISMLIYIMMSSIIITLLGERYTDILGSVAFEAENLPLVIMSQCQTLIILVLYGIMFAGLVHVSSTMVMQGHGEFDKMIFALFVVLSVGVIFTTGMYLILFVLAQLGSSLYGIIRLGWILTWLVALIYLLYCYVLSIKTVYRFSWLKAIGGGIVVPLIIIGGCVGALISTWSGNQ